MYIYSEICRFISSDDVAYIDQETIGGVNLFAYCNGNPVMNSNPSGTFAISVTGAQIVGVIGTAIALFAKGSGPRMGHNKFEKQMWKEAKRLRNIKDKDLASRIHKK